MKTGTITWDEVYGAGTLTLQWDQGACETVQHADPINAGTDSHKIANLFGGADAVEHDREYITIIRWEKKTTTLTVEFAITHTDEFDDVQIGSAFDNILHNSSAIDAIRDGLFEGSTGTDNVRATLINSDQ